MTLLRNYTRGVVTSVMKRHTGGGEGVKKLANMRYVINERPLIEFNPKLKILQSE